LIFDYSGAFTSWDKEKEKTKPRSFTINNSTFFSLWEPKKGEKGKKRTRHQVMNLKKKEKILKKTNSNFLLIIT
jgi:hypothetical protein